MAKRVRLATLKVRKPCAEDWHAMPGDERVRLCGKCNKQVHDLSVLTEDEAEKLLAAKHKPCVQYAVGPDGSIVTKPARVEAPRPLANNAGALMLMTAVACAPREEVTTAAPAPVPASVVTPPPAAPVHDDIHGPIMTPVRSPPPHVDIKPGSLKAELVEIDMLEWVKGEPYEDDSTDAVKKLLKPYFARWKKHQAELRRCCARILSRFGRDEDERHVWLSFEPGDRKVSAWVDAKEQSGCLDETAGKWRFPKFPIKGRLGTARLICTSDPLPDTPKAKNAAGDD